MTYLPTLADALLNSTSYHIDEQDMNNIDIPENIKDHIIKLEEYIKTLPENEHKKFIITGIKILFLKDKYLTSIDNEYERLFLELDDMLEDKKNEDDIILYGFCNNTVLKEIGIFFLQKNRYVSSITMDIFDDDYQNRYVVDSFIVSGEYNLFNRCYYHQKKFKHTDFGYIGIVFLTLEEDDYYINVYKKRLHQDLDYIYSKLSNIEKDDFKIKIKDNNIYIKNEFIYLTNKDEIRVLIANKRKDFTMWRWY